jgi:hypothetical protein
MWNVKTKVIRTIETTSKSFTQYLSNIPGRHETKKLKKAVTFVTAHIGLLRKERYSHPCTDLDRP